jgi:hypothetical protein
MSYVVQFCITSEPNTPRQELREYAHSRERAVRSPSGATDNAAIDKGITRHSSMHSHSCRFYPNIRNDSVPNLSPRGNGPFPGGEKDLMLNSRIIQEITLPSSSYASALSDAK